RMDGRYLFWTERTRFELHGDSLLPARVASRTRDRESGTASLPRTTPWRRKWRPAPRCFDRRDDPPGSADCCRRGTWSTQPRRMRTDVVGRATDAKNCHRRTADSRTRTVDAERRRWEV